MERIAVQQTEQLAQLNQQIKEQVLVRYLLHALEESINHPGYYRPLFGFIWISPR